MSYTKHSLTDGKTLINAQLLGEIEDGIVDAHENLDGITVSLEGTREENGRKIESYKMTLPNGKTFDFELRDGEKGDAGNVNINDGTELKFFAGTKAKYDELPDKTNVFAIITDDPTQIGLIDKINGFIDGSIPIPNLEQTYVRKDEKKVFGYSLDYKYMPFYGVIDFVYEKLPEGKTLDDIVGVGLHVRCFKSPGSNGFNLYYSGGKSAAAKFNENTGRNEVIFCLDAPVMGYPSGFTIRSHGGALARVILYIDDEEFVHIILEECYYWVDAFDNPTYTVSANSMNEGDFGLGNITYWFA